MTAFLNKNTTATISYHTADGFVHVIPRPTLSLGRVVDGNILELLTNFDRDDKPRYPCHYLVLFKPAKPATFVYVVLGCGAIVRFGYEAFEYMAGEGGRYSVDLDRLEVVQELPQEVQPDYSHLPAFHF